MTRRLRRSTGRRRVKLANARSSRSRPPQLRPIDPDPGSAAAVRLEFAAEVLAELAHRKRRQGILGYTICSRRLRDALRRSGSDCARSGCASRWPIVMVDEFQDTDPVQWQVIDSAFRGHSTLVLIGDPKQAIYGFRGGDIYTYLAAARTADDRRTLDTNWRSDSDAGRRACRWCWAALQLGHPEIVVHDGRGPPPRAAAGRRTAQRAVSAAGGRPAPRSAAQRPRTIADPDRTARPHRRPTWPPTSPPCSARRRDLRRPADQPPATSR